MVLRQELLDHWCLWRILLAFWEERTPNKNETLLNSCPSSSNVAGCSGSVLFFGARTELSTTVVALILLGMVLSPWQLADNVERLGLRSVYGHRSWKRHWVAICAGLASYHNVWFAMSMEPTFALADSRIKVKSWRNILHWRCKAHSLLRYFNHQADITLNDCAAGYWWHLKPQRFDWWSRSYKSNATSFIRCCLALQ